MVFAQSMGRAKEGGRRDLGRAGFVKGKTETIVALSSVILALLLAAVAAIMVFSPSVQEERSTFQISTTAATRTAASPSRSSSSPSLKTRNSTTATTQSPLTVTPQFSGDRAFLHLLHQTDLGPRPPGTRAHELTVEYIETTLKNLGLEVERQQFNFTDHAGASFEMTNVVGITGLRGGRLVILGAHFDTRPMADRETDPAKKKQPILGANDGASGVAVLLELARVLRHESLLVEVRLVFFDGEDYGVTLDEYCIGSRYHAESLTEEEIRRLIGVIIVDMVGDKDLEIFREGYSQSSAPELVDLVWSTARKQGYGKHFPESVGHTIHDDHVPYIERGLPAMDVIDFDYPYWHTLQDTPDKVSPRSLEVVGEVLHSVLNEISARQSCRLRMNSSSMWAGS